MKENKKPWCYDPFVQVAHTADGYYRVCCIGEVDREAGMNTNHDTPIEYLNSPNLKRLRQDMMDGNPENFAETTKAMCSQCIRNCESGIQARRDNVNELIAKTPDRLASANKVIAKLEAGDNTIEYSDLDYVNFKVLGNLCNLKCVMCSPSASSKIASEAMKHRKKSYPNLIAAEFNPFNENTRDFYFNEIDKIVSNVSRFSLVGGENLIHPNFPELLERMASNPNASNLELLIISNGTVLPDCLLDNAHKFRKLVLLSSIDGIGDKGYYVRYGLKWDQYHANMLKAQAHPDIQLAFTVSLQMLNLGYIGEIYDYLVNELNVDKNTIGWKSIVTNPEYFRAVNVPMSIKQKYKEQLLAHPVASDPAVSIDHIIKILDTEGSHEEFLHGIKKLKEFDGVRNVTLTDYFPEFAEYYDRTNN